MFAGTRPFTGDPFSKTLPPCALVVRISYSTLPFSMDGGTSQDPEKTFFLISWRIQHSFLPKLSQGSLNIFWKILKDTLLVLVFNTTSFLCCLNAVLQPNFENLKHHRNTVYVEWCYIYYTHKSDLMRTQNF